MIYEVINPSDPITLESADETIACVAALALGQGRYSLEREDGTQAMPLFLFGGVSEWLAMKHIDFGEVLENRADDVAACLETVAVVKPGKRRALFAAVGDDKTMRIEALRKWNEEKRSSMNDIAGRAFAMAKKLRDRKEASHE